MTDKFFLFYSLLRFKMKKVDLMKGQIIKKLKTRNEFHLCCKPGVHIPNKFEVARNKSIRLSPFIFAEINFFPACGLKLNST